MTYNKVTSEGLKNDKAFVFFGSMFATTGGYVYMLVHTDYMKFNVIGLIDGNRWTEAPTFAGDYVTRGELEKFMGDTVTFVKKVTLETQESE
jgi:hypothetical protein